MIGAINSGDTCNGAVVDDSGYVYQIGRANTATDFDPGPGIYNVPNNGPIGYLMKSAPNGDLIWVKVFTGFLGMSLNTITIDPNGDLVITGWHSGPMDFDPGPGTAITTNSSGQSLFVVKLNSNGIFQWYKSSGGTGMDSAFDISTDSLGNLYIIGKFEGTVDFDPGAGVYNLTSAGLEDGFILKLDSNGDFVWAKHFGSSGFDNGASLQVSESGFLYYTGSFSGTVDLDPNAGVYNLTSNGSRDLVLVKLTLSGSLIWAVSIGGTEFERHGHLTIDPSENIIFTGGYNGTIDINPNAGVQNITSVGGMDILICKVDSSGSFLWGVGFGGTSYDFGFSVSADSQGNVFSSSRLTVQDSDILLRKMNANGNTMWSGNIGGSIGPDDGLFLYHDAWDNMYLTGIASGGDMDPNSTVNLMWTSGQVDGFCMKIVECAPYVGIDTIVACDSYTWINGVTYTSNNNSATYNTNSGFGCDSTLTLNLTILNSSVGTDVVSACDSYTWINGVTYTSNNNSATYNVNNIFGCDSILTLNLTILNSSVGTDFVSACDSSVWLDGNTYYTNNNSAAWMLTNSDGCDSLVTLDLTIGDVNTSVTINSPTLMSEATGSMYQWINCDNNNSIINGETNQSFTAAVNGNYAVIITTGNCSDTSLCYSVLNVGISSVEFDNSISIFPNPTTQELNVQLGQKYSSIEVEISTLLGQVIFNQSYKSKKYISLNLEGSKGVYLMTIRSLEKQSTYRVIKQ
jgi:hypothetical protein